LALEGREVAALVEENLARSEVEVDVGALDRPASGVNAIRLR
jgi:hypothetical protein